MFLDAPSKIWFYSIYFAYCNVFHEREHTCVINYKRNMHVEHGGDHWYGLLVPKLSSEF